jgi:hypothetical protein
LLFEGSQPCSVESRGSIFLDFMAESVGIVVHPRQQRRNGFVWFGAGGLTSFDPEADEFMGELAEAAIRIIEFICFCMAARRALKRAWARWRRAYGFGRRAPQAGSQRRNLRGSQ